ncbi:MAG: DNA repair protein RadC [Moraxellaceae bacterium]|nr:DNA repair protein RadC [Moraxellaceae bacterium]
MKRKKEDTPALVTGLLMADGKGGYTPATGDKILAVAREVAEQRLAKGTCLDSPGAVRECLPALLGAYSEERFGVLFLDSQNKLIAYEEMFRGTLSATVVYPREIVKAALGHHAASVILAHNHPSGSREPSQADIQITQRIKDALALLEIRVTDHFIATGTTTVSMAEKGLI